MVEYHYSAPSPYVPSGCQEGNYSPGILPQRRTDARRREAFKPNDVNGDNKLDLRSSRS
jgi:hypothetical protein